MVKIVIFFVLVDEAEELGNFKNNGIGVDPGRNANLLKKFHSMVKPKDSGSEEVCRAKVDG